jgi:hypothetical protein
MSEMRIGKNGAIVQRLRGRRGERQIERPGAGDVRAVRRAWAVRDGVMFFL